MSMDGVGGPYRWIIYYPNFSVFFQNLQGLPPLVDLCSFKQLLRCLDTQEVLATKVSKIPVISQISGHL